MSNSVILVDKHDRKLGLMPKIEAHEKGLLHRAFSIFIFNSTGQMLIQKRASSKYHTPGLWTNACCSHQVDGEDVQDGLSRRLTEEMGLRLTSFNKAFEFVYKAELDNGLFEHELDHVYISVSDEQPQPNPEEVEDFKYVEPELLLIEVEKTPHLFTPWFKLLLKPVLDYYSSNSLNLNK